MLNTARSHVSDITTEGKGLLSPESIAALDASVKKLFEHYLDQREMRYLGDPDIKVSDQAAGGNVRLIRNANPIGDGKLKKWSMDSKRIGFLNELLGDKMLYLENDIVFDQGPPISNRINTGLHHRSSSVTLKPEQLREAIDQLAASYGITDFVRAAAVEAEKAAQLGAAKG